MTNNKRIIAIVSEAMQNQKVTPAELCRETGVPKWDFSRWINQKVDPRNTSGRPATIRGEYLINILSYLKII